HVRFQWFPASCLPARSHSRNSSTLAIRRAFIRFAKASTPPLGRLCFFRLSSLTALRFNSSHLRAAAGRLSSRLHLENHRKDEGPFGSLLVDVAFQVDADLFFDDAPVGVFLGVRFRHGLHQNFARSDQKL